MKPIYVTILLGSVSKHRALEGVPVSVARASDGRTDVTIREQWAATVREGGPTAQAALDEARQKLVLASSRSLNRWAMRGAADGGVFAQRFFA
jgi:hypothetical protein